MNNYGATGLKLSLGLNNGVPALKTSREPNIQLLLAAHTQQLYAVTDKDLACAG